MADPKEFEIEIPVFRLGKAGGIERYTWEVALELSRGGYSVRMLSPNGGSAPPPGVSVLTIGRERRTNSVLGGISLATFGPRAAARSRMLGRPAVRYGPVGSAMPPGVVTALSVHAAWVRDRRRALGPMRTSAFDRALVALERHTYRSPRVRVTAISPSCADEIADFYPVPRESIPVIPPAIDPSEFSPVDEEERLESRRLYQLHPDAFVVGTVANYAFLRKGVDVLVRGCGRVGATLLIAGTADRRHHDYSELAREKGTDARFVGHVGNMRRFYAALDVFALPSFYEPYGMAAHEAMACGVVTVLSRRCGIVDLLEPDREALVVEAGDADDLTRVLTVAQDQQRARAIAAQGARWALGHTWDRVGRAIEDELRAYHDSFS